MPEDLALSPARHLESPKEKDVTESKSSTLTTHSTDRQRESVIKTQIVAQVLKHGFLYCVSTSGRTGQSLLLGVHMQLSKETVPLLKNKQINKITCKMLYS